MNASRYDEDIARLRHEIEARGGPPSHVGVSGLPPHGGVSQPAPPAIGHGPSNLFGGIMANPPGQGNPGLVPPSQDQQQQQQQQGPPPHQMPQPQQGLQSGPYQGSYPQPPVVNGKTHGFVGIAHSLLSAFDADVCVQVTDRKRRLHLQVLESHATTAGL